MAWRDACADDGRDGAKQLRDQEKVSLDFSPTTIAEQNAAGGYNKTDRPVGGNVPVQKNSTGSAD